MATFTERQKELNREILAAVGKLSTIMQFELSDYVSLVEISHRLPTKQYNFDTHEIRISYFIKGFNQICGVSCYIDPHKQVSVPLVDTVDRGCNRMIHDIIGSIRKYSPINEPVDRIIDKIKTRF